MSHVSFGSGVLLARATNSAGVVTGTPNKFGVLQSASIDISATAKELFGQYNYPVAVARGTSKISGKASSANLDSRMYNELFFNGGLTEGKQELIAIDEVQAISATVTATNAASFKKDYGVTNGITGVGMIRVASAPTAGQYSVVETTGVYAFAAADVTAAFPVKLNYEFQSTDTSGEIITISQQMLGVAPRFQIALATLYDGNMFTLTLNACVSTKWSFGTKLEDFSMPDFEWSSFADAAGNVGTLSSRRV